MIRINLLEETRTQAKGKGGGGFAMPEFQVAENVGIFVLGGAVVLAGALVAVWAFWNLAELNSLQAKIAEAEKEKARLEHVLRQDQILKERQADLTRKIDVIGDLKENQAVPVQMLDQISRNLADHVWLADLTFLTDHQLTLVGYAQDPLGVSNFLRNLEESEWFSAVEMGTVEQARSGDRTKFTLKAKFGKPKPPGSEDAAAGSSASKAPSPAGPTRGSGGRR